MQGILLDHSILEEVKKKILQWGGSANEVIHPTIYSSSKLWMET